jgi:hypothetical protein
MWFYKDRILHIYPTVSYLKLKTKTAEQVHSDQILAYLETIKKHLNKSIFKVTSTNKTDQGLFDPFFVNTIKRLLQPLLVPHFSYFNLWGSAWYKPFVRLKLLKPNLADLEALDYAMATVFFIMANDDNADMGRKKKLQSQFLGHIIKGAWWRLSDTARYKIGAKILSDKPALALYLSDYYADSLEHVIRLYPDVFNSAGGGGSLYQNGEGCIAMLEEIAASQTFGDFDKVSKLPVHTLFIYLKHQAIKVRAQQAAQNNN